MQVLQKFTGLLPLLSLDGRQCGAVVTFGQQVAGFGVVFVGFPARFQWPGRASS
jgi:hypothetical protein